MSLLNRLALVSGGAALLTACTTGTGGWEIPASLDCSPEALHVEHVRQVGGTFTEGELASRGVGDAAHAPDADGLLGGAFSLWKEVVDAVPFDPPGNTVCQVLLFDGAEAASRFLSSLQPASSSLSRASIGWPQEGAMDVEELAGDGDTTRVFAVGGYHVTGEQRLLLAFRQAGHYVVAVHAGGPDQSPELDHLLPPLSDLAERALAEQE